MKKLYAVILFATLFAYAFYFSGLHRQVRTYIQDPETASYMLFSLYTGLIFVIGIPVLVGMLFYKKDKLSIRDISDGTTVYEIVCARVWRRDSVLVVIRKKDDDNPDDIILRIIPSDKVDFKYGPEELRTPNAAQYRFLPGNEFRSENNEGEFTITFLKSNEKPQLV